MVAPWETAPGGSLDLVRERLAAGQAAQERSSRYPKALWPPASQSWTVKRMVACWPA
jgi:hypothetical protein